MPKAPKTKKFGGKTFYLQTLGSSSKIAAKNTAKWLRKQPGHKRARVVKIEQSYQVYTRGS